MSEPSTLLQGDSDKEKRRYGIGEWYGRLFMGLTAEERRLYAERALSSSSPLPCPFRYSCSQWDPRAFPPEQTACTKRGGVCSLAEHIRITQGTQVLVRAEPALKTTCPYRFLEDGKIFQWVGERLLGTRSPLVLSEIEFLQVRTPSGSLQTAGKIDHVLVHPSSVPIQWCALEMQAVYFSGANMTRDFETILADPDGPYFPDLIRRPDYRSSGLKRLLPQLQTKVPTLRRWGKKLAVVVDDSFYAALGQLKPAEDLSSCDIAWFVVTYQATGPIAKLTEAGCYLTTLEDAVEGLTGGRPITQPAFEELIAKRIRTRYPEHAASLGLAR
jgi:hypothetical protein